MAFCGLRQPNELIIPSASAGPSLSRWIFQDLRHERARQNVTLPGASKPKSFRIRPFHPLPCRRKLYARPRRSKPIYGLPSLSKLEYIVFTVFTMDNSKDVQKVGSAAGRTAALARRLASPSRRININTFHTADGKSICANE
jgi:hypothetical protein